MFLPETIPACPPQLSQAAFHVALRELPVEQRREVISEVPQSDTDGLFAVTDGGGHLNACFVQR